MSWQRKDDGPRFDPRLLGARCDECPLSDCRPVPPEGPEDAPIIFVGEAPGRQEVISGRPFVGPSGVELDRLLKENGLRRSEVKISNAILCRAEVPELEGRKKYEVKNYIAWIRKQNVRLRKYGEEPINDPFDCCWPRLRREIWTADRYARLRGAPNGVVVMPLGNFALKRIASVTGIMKYRGSVISMDSANPLDGAP